MCSLQVETPTLRNPFEVTLTLLHFAPSNAASLLLYCIHVHRGLAHGCKSSRNMAEALLTLLVRFSSDQITPSFSALQVVSHGTLPPSLHSHPTTSQSWTPFRIYFRSSSFGPDSRSIFCSCSRTALFNGKILGLHNISARPPLQKRFRIVDGIERIKSRLEHYQRV